MSSWKSSWGMVERNVIPDRDLTGPSGQVQRLLTMMQENENVTIVAKLDEFATLEATLHRLVGDLVNRSQQDINELRQAFKLQPREPWPPAARVARD